MHLSLSGRVALITGGSRGIGAAAVRMFVAAGARVLFNYEKSKPQADQLAKELGNDKCAAVACNLSGTETARELVASTVDRFGRLDILVANHGVWPPEDVPIDQMRRRAVAQHGRDQSRQRVRAHQAFRCPDEEAEEVRRLLRATSCWSVLPRDSVARLFIATMLRPRVR